MKRFMIRVSILLKGFVLVNKYKTISRAIRLLAILFILLTGFFWGAATVAYKITPFNNLIGIYEKFQKKEQKTGDEELLQYAFNDPALSSRSYFPNVRSLKDLQGLNQDIFISQEWFSSAFKEIRIGDTEELVDSEGHKIIKVSFQLNRRRFEAFAYGSKPENCGSKQVSVFVIPGSGFNQGFAIASRNDKNYHAGIFPLLDNGAVDPYVLIKPNEDFLSWTNGSGKKVTGDFIFNWHINRGGSYSVSYLTQALAVQKYLESCFKQTVIAGLSQGGFAALLVGLQSAPTTTIVASGYSVVTRVVEWSGPQQIIGVPNQAELYKPEVIKQALEESPTNWLFTWGLSEVGTHRIEARDLITFKILNPLTNVESIVHNGGHEFPMAEIYRFLQKYEVPLK